MQTGIARTPIKHTAIAKITLRIILASFFLHDAMFSVLLPCIVTKIDLLFFPAADDCVITAGSDLIDNTIDQRENYKAADGNADHK